MLPSIFDARRSGRPKPFLQYHSPHSQDLTSMLTGSLHLGEEKARGMSSEGVAPLDARARRHHRDDPMLIFQRSVCSSSRDSHVYAAKNEFGTMSTRSIHMHLVGNKPKLLRFALFGAFPVLQCFCPSVIGSTSGCDVREILARENNCVSPVVPAPNRGAGAPNDTNHSSTS